MKAFLTGSRVCGTPNSSSDIDLVVFVSTKDLDQLSELALADGANQGSQGTESMSFRFGRLNLLATDSWDYYQTWVHGTEQLKSARPVLRDQAVALFTLLRAAIPKPPRSLSLQEAGPVVDVSLLVLVQVPNSERAWPEDFRGKIDKLLEDVNEKTAWGVIADWLDEHDEPELGEAFRWVMKRTDVKLESALARDGNFDAGYKRYYFSNLPHTLFSYPNIWDDHSRNIPQVVAKLSKALERLKKDLA